MSQNVRLKSTARRRKKKTDEEERASAMEYVFISSNMYQNMLSVPDLSIVIRLPFWGVNLLSKKSHRNFDLDVNAPGNASKKKRTTSRCNRRLLHTAASQRNETLVIFLLNEVHHIHLKPSIYHRC